MKPLRCTALFIGGFGVLTMGLGDRRDIIGDCDVSQIMSIRRPRSKRIEADMDRIVRSYGQERDSNDLSPHEMLHRLWSACVGKQGYDKSAWREIEQQLKSAGVIR